MENVESSYDLVTYPGYTHPQTHPDRLAVIGALFGLSPASVTRCRVLELGCGNGSNLVPMAFVLPESSFVGIDLAIKPIAQGRQMANELGLKNIELIQADITQFDGQHGQFDYIIAHGLFSWVPPEVREQTLALCHKMLAPDGIAFISYNALPGSHLRSLARDMMRFHVRGISSPPERVAQARAVVQFVAEAQNTEDESRLWMRKELERIRDYDDGHLFHDDLSEISQPFYFTQFIEQAARHRLKFLAEADYFEMSENGLDEKTRAVLGQLSASRILREQYLDFLKCRRFRQTLLCHAEAAITDAPGPAKMENFFVTALAHGGDDAQNLQPGKIVTYATPKGARCATDFPLGKAALLALGENGWLPFGDLLAKALAKLSAAGLAHAGHDARGELSAFLLQLYGAGTVNFSTWLPPVAARVSERPLVTALARWQIRRQNHVISPFHQSIQIGDEIGRLLLAALDGTQDHAALLEKVLALLQSKNALRENDPAAARAKVAAELQQNLEKLLHLGLLVA